MDPRIDFAVSEPCCRCQECDQLSGSIRFTKILAGIMQHPIAHLRQTMGEDVPGEPSGIINLLGFAFAIKPLVLPDRVWNQKFRHKVKGAPGGFYADHLQTFRALQDPR